MPVSPESIDRLKSQLLTSGLQQKDQALFQVINQLIDGVRQALFDTVSLAGGGSGGGGAVLTQTFITKGPEQGSLVNSRRLVAGSGIGFNDDGQRIILHATYPPLPGEERDEEAYIPLPGPQGQIGPTGPAGSGVSSPILLPCAEEIFQEFISLPLGNVKLPPYFKDVPFAAGNFTASGAMTWTVAAGDVQGYAYKVIDDAYMILFVQVITSSLGGVASNTLQVAIPDGWRTANTFTIPGFAIKDSSVSGVHEVIIVNANALATVIRLFLLGAINWPLTTNTTNVYFLVGFPVTR